MKILDRSILTDWLKPRVRDAHKGCFGHVLIAGGQPGYSGAVRMAAEAALRTGAGLVSVATHPRHADQLNNARPEIMTHAIAMPEDLAVCLQRATTVVLGPGLGQSEWSQMVFETVISAQNVDSLAGKLQVIDADGLILLAGFAEKLEFCNLAHCILTPHPGEAARMLAKTSAAIQGDRLMAAKLLQKKFGAAIVLKGAGTLVLLPDGNVSLCKAGNPGMASGGMGDILSGVIGGLLAQGIPLPAAAEGGVLLHARAGDKAAEKYGERGMLATDLLPSLYWLVNHW